MFSWITKKTVINIWSISLWAKKSWEIQLSSTLLDDATLYFTRAVCPMNENPYCSITSPTLGIIRFQKLSCKKLWYNDFNLHFLISFQVVQPFIHSLIGHLYYFFNLSLFRLLPIFNSVFNFRLFRYVNSLCISCYFSSVKHSVSISIPCRMLPWLTFSWKMNFGF